jgi:hypothetical protein
LHKACGDNHCSIENGARYNDGFLAGIARYCFRTARGRVGVVFGAKGLILTVDGFRGAVSDG